MFKTSYMKQAFVIIFLFAVFASKSQPPEYYVYLIKGNAVQRKPNGQSTPVKQNSLVYKSDVVILKEDAALTLVNKQVQNLVLKAAGMYKVADLSKKLHVSSSGIAKQYLSMLWHELMAPNYGYSKLRRSNLSASWGGLSTRGDLCNNRIFPINGLKAAADSLHFRWQATSPSSTYNLQLFSGDGTELMNRVVKDTQALVPVKEVVNNQAGKYYWLVKSSDGTCEDEVPFYLDIMSKEEETWLVQNLLSSTSGEEIIDKLQGIDKLEKQALINAASTQFRNLVNAYPDNGVLKKSYASFLLKYGFKEEASLLWND